MDIPTSLPILPLVDDATPVLLPGMIARLPIQHRSDAQLILAHSLTKGIREARSSASLLGCVPMRSPQLSQNGQRVLKSKGDPRSRNERPSLDPTTITRDELFNYGCVAKILGVQGRGTGELSFLIEGISRFKLGKIRNDKPYMEAEVRHHIEDVHFTQDPAIQELFARLKQQSQEFLAFLKVSSLLPRKPSPLLLRRLEIYIEKKTVEEASLLGDFMTNIVDASVEDKLEVLATWDLQERLEKIIEILSKQMETINGNMKVTSISIMSLPDRAEKNKNGNSQRDITRRNLLSFGTGQLPTFPPGSGQDNEEEADELMELRKRLEDAKMSAEAQKVADKELKRLTKMNPAQLEYQVCRNYLETLAEIPWSRMSEDRLGLETLSRARKQLDDDHYGLEKVKKRLLEYLAVLKLKHSINSELDMKIEKLSNKDASSSKDSTDDHEVKDSDTSEVKLQLLKSKRMVDKSPILLLVGPPGTGKTSLAKSVATALGRKFHRISLGGVRDEAEIRGHRKTYVAAMPGLIVNGLKKVGVANPVFLLDEIDKVGTSSFHGDPSAAMLEVLDPEQNCTFTDHYVNIPIDLSTVLFIATANSLDTIPPPLLDRMETISLSGYTTLEKRHIATRHLIPKQILTNGLGSNDVRFKDEVIDQIINSYTREAGVRNLEREIGSVCRAKAVEYSEAKDASAIEQYNAQVSLEDLERILGVEKFEEELAEKTARPGLVTGLVAYSTGGNGGILFIEIVDMPGRGRVQLTGKLGDVLKESVEVALSWVKAHSYDLGLTEDPTADIMVKRNIHVHCPAGAIPKDGPSAGLAHTIALISLFSGNAVPSTLAMTGEISLRGKVLAVGGIKEKLIGALRARVRTVIIPAANERDLKDLPSEVIGKDGLKIIPVKHIWEAMTYVWPEKRWRGNHHVAGIESQL